MPAISIDAIANSAEYVNLTVVSWGHVVAAAADDLWVAVTDIGGPDPSSVDWNGTALTFVVGVINGDGHRAYLYRLKDPAAGSFNVNCFWATINGRGIAGSLSTIGVGIIGVTDTNTFTATSDAVVVSTQPGGLTIEAAFVHNSGGPFSENSGQTAVYDIGLATGGRQVTMNYKLGAQTLGDLSWVNNQPGSHVGVSYNLPKIGDSVMWYE